MILALFAHTDRGSRALRAVLATGVEPEAIAVIGDLGIPAGEAGSMHHVTLDRLHIPTDQRDRFMDGIRSGGVVLAVVQPGTTGIDEIMRKHEALLVEETPDSGPAISHNPA